ncbi:MAG: hypothetical protein IKL47_14555 [Clostridia bacterium]|nr:hypothetical protein [Clostridia bacterium]
MKLKEGLNNNQLKLIAMFTMLLDHAGRQLFPEADILMTIGRIAFPVFSYMIAEGCKYTKNKKKYLLIMAGMALVCQCVYFFTSGSLYMNVLMTFVLSILCIYAGDNFRKKKNFTSALLMALQFSAVIFLCVILPRLVPETDFTIDYGIFGVLLPVGVYFAPKKSHKLIVTSVFLILLALSMNPRQWFGFLSLPLLILYNGKRGKKNLKLLFYIFYPTHLAVIYLIDMLIQ